MASGRGDTNAMRLGVPANGNLSLQAFLAAAFVAFSLRRPAQYFFIRSETARFCASDMFQLRFRPPLPFRGVSVPAAVADAVALPRDNSGNARTIDAISAFKASRRDCAPISASRFTSTRLRVLAIYSLLPNVH